MTAAASPASAIYQGVVTHRRERPRRHELRYRVFYLLLDLDELALADAPWSLLRRDRRGWLAFHQRDHLAGSGRLRQEVEQLLAEAGIDLAGGPIRLLTLPRMLGYAFNPLSVYFCHHADGTLRALLHEVHNTFGQRHSYLIPVTPGEEGPITRSCAKRFHVSPFLDMDLTYRFRVVPPAETIVISVAAADATGPLIATSFTGRRLPLTDASLLRAVLAHPLLTLKVIAGIHWEALKIWRKGIAIRRLPPPPAFPVTIVSEQAR